MIKKYIGCITLFLVAATSVWGQYSDPRIRTYIPPTRIVWQEAVGGSLISGTDLLLKTGNGQAVLTNNGLCTLKSTKVEAPSILLDFGKELQGGLRIVTGRYQAHKPVKIRVRLGESVSEAMTPVGTKGATNDHAMRDFEIELPWLGVAETAHSGFRFARIDLLTPDVELLLKEVSAVSVIRDIPYRGSFRCNDERLNQIWMTGAYTVHLNMQEYLWDAIKRDRLVWVGDMHPEVMTINTVFGNNEVVPKSLDLSRDTTPLPKWMNDISSYSLWWILIHKEWYLYQGDLMYLKKQQPYLTELLNLLLTKVDASGKEQLDGKRFLDWPSERNRKGIDAGLQALLLMTFDAGAMLCEALGDPSLAATCRSTTARMKQYVPGSNGSKQAAALLALSGLVDAREANDRVLSVGGAKNFSTFYGYYMLQAQAQAGDYQGAMNIIRTYWGGMLDMGATSFWEDFNMDWLSNAAPIDALVPEGKKDIHGDFGSFCYSNLRHSLCHGWASGPTSWLSEHVLGIKVLAPGCRILKVEPHLSDLEWVEGTFPTPLGDVFISHRKQNGKVITKVKSPKGIKVIYKRTNEL